VVVNLRPDEDAETQFVAFDRLRVVHVLERIAADLDTLGLALIFHNAAANCELSFR